MGRLDTELDPATVEAQVKAKRTPKLPDAAPKSWANRAKQARAQLTANAARSNAKNLNSMDPLTAQATLKAQDAMRADKVGKLSQLTPRELTKQFTSGAITEEMYNQARIRNVSDARLNQMLDNKDIGYGTFTQESQRRRQAAYARANPDQVSEGAVADAKSRLGIPNSPAKTAVKPAEQVVADAVAAKKGKVASTPAVADNTTATTKTAKVAPTKTATVAGKNVKAPPVTSTPADAADNVGADDAATSGTGKATKPVNSTGKGAAIPKTQPKGFVDPAAVPGGAADGPLTNGDSDLTGYQPKPGDGRDMTKPYNRPTVQTPEGNFKLPDGRIIDPNGVPVTSKDTAGVVEPKKGFVSAEDAGYPGAETPIDTAKYGVEGVDAAAADPAAHGFEGVPEKPGLLSRAADAVKGAASKAKGFVSELGAGAPEATGAATAGEAAATAGADAAGAATAAGGLVAKEGSVLAGRNLLRLAGRGGAYAQAALAAYEAMHFVGDYAREHASPDTMKAIDSMYPQGDPSMMPNADSTPDVREDQHGASGSFDAPASSQGNAAAPSQVNKAGGGSNSDFGKAFRIARNNNQKYFPWNGKMYTSRFKEETTDEFNAKYPGQDSPPKQ